MPEDPRTGWPENGTVTITDSDGDAPQTVYQPEANHLFQITQIKIEYDNSGAANGVTVDLFDDADGTTSGNVSDQRDTYNDLQPGEVRTVDNLNMRDFEEDILVQSVGDNHDADIDVTVYGYEIMALSDMVGVA